MLAAEMPNSTLVIVAEVGPFGLLGAVRTSSIARCSITSASIRSSATSYSPADPLLAQHPVEKLDRFARRVGARLDERADVGVRHRREHLADAPSLRDEVRIGRHFPIGAAIGVDDRRVACRAAGPAICRRAARRASSRTTFCAIGSVSLPASRSESSGAFGNSGRGTSLPFCSPPLCVSTLNLPLSIRRWSEKVLLVAVMSISPCCSANMSALVAAIADDPFRVPAEKADAPGRDQLARARDRAARHPSSPGLRRSCRAGASRRRCSSRSSSRRARCRRRTRTSPDRSATAASR